MSSHTSMNEQTLDQLQRAAFGYFLQAVNPANGLIADTSRENSPASIGVVGFALSAYPVAVERGWMQRADAVQRSLATLRFFYESDQSGSPEATGYNGFYYHFLDMRTGARVWRSELSMIDSALLIAGALTAGRYFTANTADEIRLRELVDVLYCRVDWRWAQNRGTTINHGWKPESGFLHYCWDGYSEAIVLYVLALGSPAHPIEGDCYQAWTAFTIPMHDVDRAIADDEQAGFVKIHVRERSDRILGATIVARHAGEMINEITLAMVAGIGLRTLARVIHAYPTQADAIKKAADAYNRTRLTPTIQSLLRRWLAW